MTKTLFLAWQDKRDKINDTATRRWFPIGRLDANRGTYWFRYIRGVEQARREAGFQALDAFPDLERIYQSDRLFELFLNRVPRASRADYPTLLERLGLPKGEMDPFEILALTGGARQTDNLEAFPKLVKKPDGSFRCQFFLHGWRHVSQEAQTRLTTLRAGDELRVSLELNNPASGAAIQMQSADTYHMLGWAPRYLVHDLIEAIAQAPMGLSARVSRMNVPPAPSNQRVLITLTGQLPLGMEPMSSVAFQPLAA
jgi:hypothetical protein